MLTDEDLEIIRQLIREVIREEIPAFADAVVAKMRQVEISAGDSVYEALNLPHDEFKRRQRARMLAENRERKARAKAKGE
jgi:hypothetical protein